MGGLARAPQSEGIATLPLCVNPDNAFVKQPIS